jgi:hypothetical protein
MLDRLEVTLAKANQPQVGADEIDVGDAMALDDGTRGLARSEF